MIDNLDPFLVYEACLQVPAITAVGALFSRASDASGLPGSICASLPCRVYFRLLNFQDCDLASWLWALETPLNLSGNNCSG